MRNFEYHNSSKRKEVVKKIENLRNLKIEKEINSKRVVGIKKVNKSRSDDMWRE